jgi:pyrroloquinoline quinone biosynthesis protein B
MKVRILGSAAGGGVPQWNCACPVCAACRQAGADRTQDTVAVTGDDRSWFLLNASPDLRQQLLGSVDLTPAAGSRRTPLIGVLLSTAEIDHTLGLLTLREATCLEVLASGTVLGALQTSFPVRPMLDRYTDISWQEVPAGATVALAGGLTAARHTIGAKAPRYADGTTGREWVSAWEITDPTTGGVLLYATCVPQWTDDLVALVGRASCAILDGTFLTDDELQCTVGRGPTAMAMGHAPVSASLPIVGSVGGRVLYSHLNNTNPLVRPDPEGTAGRLGGAAEAAHDGQQLVL